MDLDLAKLLKTTNILPFLELNRNERSVHEGTLNLHTYTSYLLVEEKTWKMHFGETPR